MDIDMAVYAVIAAITLIGTVALIEKSLESKNPKKRVLILLGVAVVSFIILLLSVVLSVTPLPGL